MPSTSRYPVLKLPSDAQYYEMPGTRTTARGLPSLGSTALYATYYSTRYLPTLLLCRVRYCPGVLRYHDPMRVQYCPRLYCIRLGNAVSGTAFLAYGSPHVLCNVRSDLAYAPTERKLRVRYAATVAAR
eukprot:6707-Rhodomonas_salina.2